MKKGKNFNHPVKGSSIKVEPIKDMKDIKAIETLLADNPRNLALFTLGINTGLRMVDLLEIRHGQIQDLKPGDRIELRKKGHAKSLSAELNSKSVKAVQQLIHAKRNQAKKGKLKPNDYLFEGPRGVLSVPTVNNLVKKWCATINLKNSLRLKGSYGCHTLRKTYGYIQVVHRGISPIELMADLNHSNVLQTIEYIGLLPEVLESIVHKKTKSFKKSGSQLKQETLRDSKEIYKLIFENANDLIICTDIGGYVIDLNNKVKEIYGYNRKDFLGKHYSEIGARVFSTETQKVIVAAYDDAVAAEKILNRKEIEVLRSDGTTAIVEANSVFLKKNSEIIATINIMRDITERKHAEKKLQTAHKELEQKVKERTASLEEMNSALKVLLKKRDEDKVELEDKILFNMKELIVPVLEKLEKSRLDERQKTLLGILETNLNDIVSPFVQGVSIKNLRLTPTEIQVANLIKQGKSTKEVAGLLYSSESAIIFHRHNIRKKLGIISKKINLRSFLQTMQ